MCMGKLSVPCEAFEFILENIFLCSFHVNSYDDAGSNESMMIVQALIEVASHPEYDITSMTFNFWHSLQVILTGR